MLCSAFEKSQKRVPKNRVSKNSLFFKYKPSNTLCQVLFGRELQRARQLNADILLWLLLTAVRMMAGMVE